MKFRRMNSQGTIENIGGADTVVLYDIAGAQQLSDMPAGEFLFPVWLTDAAGVRMPVLVPASVLRQPREMLAAQVAQINGLVANVEAQQAAVQGMVSQLAQRKAPVDGLAQITIGGSSLIQATAGEKTFANLSCPGIRMTDQVFLTVVSMPGAYGLKGFSVPADNQITIRVYCPVLAIAGPSLVFQPAAFR